MYHKIKVEQSITESEGLYFFHTKYFIAKFRKIELPHSVLE